MADNNEAAAILGEIWVEVLNLPENPSTDARFFAFGGDSITCVRMVALARKRGIELTLRDVLEDDELISLANRSVSLGETE